MIFRYVAFFLLAVWIFAPLFAQPVEDRTTLKSERPVSFVSAISGLFLRQSPGTDAPTIRLLKYATPLEVLKRKEPFERVGDKEGQWLLVKTEDVTGWVFGAYVTHAIPASPIRHWNASHTMYFVVTSKAPGGDCASAYNYDQPCWISAFDSRGNVMRPYQGAHSGSVGSAGWEKDEIELFTYGVDGGGGGSSNTLWSPVTGQEHEIFHSYFIPNRNKDGETTSVLFEICFKDKCHFIEQFEKTHTCDVWQGQTEKRVRKLQTFRYKRKCDLTLADHRPQLNVDDAVYFIVDSELQRQ
ncbi:MAG TPA: SH3 domain-containing protein [Leptospiraceae bacterium]|nr:SH3 domain-containing protein [Leptospiraceae bacterium]HNE22946.1 SH3 domain-containing protein [Leptospiraceae bacterium]